MVEWYRGQTRNVKVVVVVVAAVVIWMVGSYVLGVVYDRDCRHFSSHAQAQTFYHLTGGPVLDFHNLDGDDDGKACERLR